MSWLMAFWLICASAVHAADFYVSKQGSDSHTCVQAQSPTTPRLKISSGASCLKPGDTLWVKAGVYNEQLSNVIPSGTSNTSVVTVAAFAGDLVTLQPLTGMTGALSFTGPNHAYIVINGINIDCVNASTDCVSIRGGAHHIKMRNSEVKNSPGVGVLQGGNSEFTKLSVHHHKGDGFRLSQPRNVIEDSEVHSNGGSGIHLAGNPGNNDNTSVRNNRIHSNNTAGAAGAGIIVGSGANVRVHNNIINSQSNTAASHGIQAVYAVNAQIFNNTISDNPGFGIFLGPDVSGARVMNNVISSNVKGGISNSGTGTILTNNIVNP